VSICCDSQANLKALHAVRTSPFGPNCQKALNNNSTRHAMGLFCFHEHAGVRGNEIADELARGGTLLGFFGPEPTLGVSRRDI